MSGISCLHHHSQHPSSSSIQIIWPHHWPSAAVMACFARSICPGMKGMQHSTTKNNTDTGTQGTIYPITPRRSRHQPRQIKSQNKSFACVLLRLPFSDTASVILSGPLGQQGHGSGSAGVVLSCGLAWQDMAWPCDPSGTQCGNSELVVMLTCLCGSCIISWPCIHKQCSCKTIDKCIAQTSTNALHSVCCRVRCHRR